MNCGKCNAPLNQGNPICPNCGTMNIITPNSSSSNSNEQIESLNDFVELDDNDEKVEITENMAPPSLVVEEENLGAGAGDLNNTTNVTDYAPEAQEQEKEAEAKKQTLESENVDIAIPSVQKPVDNIVMPTDGSAPEVVQDNKTVGSVNTTTEVNNTNQKGKFKIKFHKGSKNVPKNLMIIVAIIFLVIGILLGKVLFSKNYCVSSNRNNILNTNKIKFVNDGKNNVTNIGSYSYKIPEQYIYDKKDGGVYIYNKEDTFRIYIRTDLGSFADMTGAKNSIRETLRENDVVINNMRELSFEDVEFLVFEGATKSINRLIGFGDASHDYVYYVEIVTVDNSYNYDVLKIAADILKNATFEPVESKMEKIEIYDISDVAIKAAMEYKNLVANN